MVCYELAMNTETQQTLQEEICAVTASLNDKPIDFETLHKMKFLDMVVSEGLRKWPPSPQLDRTCSKDFDMDLGEGRRIAIKRGQLVIFPVYHIHRDPSNYENPEKFDPYRFSDKNRESLKPEAFLSFGIGPRVCVGSRFALMSAKLLFFHLFQKFTVEKCDKTPENPTYQANMTFRIKETIYLRFRSRK